MKKEFMSLLLLAAFGQAAVAQKTFSVNVTNKAKTERKAVPVVLQLKNYGGMEVKCRGDMRRQGNSVTARRP